MALIPLHCIAQAVQYSYDQLGRISSVVDQNGAGAQYAYDSNGNIVSITRFAATTVAILSFFPVSGAPGEAVTLSGINFGATPAQNTVTFNGVSATIVSASANQILVNVPLNATTGPIVVNAPTGSATSSQPFTVNSSNGPPVPQSITPSIATAGSSVLLQGTAFGTPSQNDLVGINGVAVTNQTGATTTQIPFTVPTAAGSGHLSIIAPNGAARSSFDLYIPPSPYTANQVEVAARVADGGSTPVAIATANDIGMVLSDGSPERPVNLQLTNSTYSCVFFSILSTSNSQITQGDACGSNGGLQEVTLPSAGTYTALILPANGSTGSATVTLSTDQSEAIALGTSEQISTSVPGQNVRLTFSGTASELVNLQLTNSTYTCVFYSILSSNGTQVSVGDTCGSTGGLPEVALPSTGTYTALISPYYGSTGSATVTLSTDETGSTTIGTSASISNDLPGQNVRLAFSGTAGQAVNLQITNSTYLSCIGATYSILNPDGSQLASGYTCNATGGLQEVVLPTTGTYTALISPGNGSIGSATVTLSTDVTGSATIGTSDQISNNLPGQNMQLTFSGTAGQSVNLQISNSTFSGCLSMTFSILNPDGSQLSSGNTCSSTGGLQEVALPSTGTYTALISPANGQTGSATVTLSTDETASTTIGTNDQISNNLPGQNVQLAFSGTAGQFVNLQITNSTYSGCVALTFSILNPDGSELSSGNTCSSTGGLQEVALPSTGTYTALISPANGQTGSATVTVSTDETGSTTIGTSDQISNNLPGQNVRVTFSGTAGQLVNLQVINSTYSGCIALTYSILNPDGSQLASGYTCNANGGLEEVALPSTGAYTALISPGNGATGSATVILSTDEIASTTIGTSDQISNNLPGQNVRLAFSGTAGQLVNLQITNSTYSGCIALTFSILNPDGSQLSSGVTCGSTGQLLEVALPSTGTYTALISPGNGATGSATVTLSVDENASTTIGTSDQISNNLPGQNVRLAFSGTAGQFVNLQITNSTYSVCVALNFTIYNPDGSQLSSGFMCGSTGQLLEVALPTTGTYTILISPGYGSTGSATVTLSIDDNQSTTIGTSAQISNNLPGQNMRLAFSGTTGQLVNFQITNSTYADCISLTFTIMNPDGSQLSSGYMCNSAGDLEEVPLPSTGTYTILITPGYGSTGSATATLSTDQTGSITLGSSEQFSTSLPGQNVRLSFSGTTGQSVNLQITNSTYSGCTGQTNSLNFYILNPDGSQLSSGNTCSATGGLQDVTLPSTGTFTALISPGNGATGSATVALSTN